MAEDDVTDLAVGRTREQSANCEGAPMIDHHGEPLAQVISRQLATAYARDRVAASLYSAVVEGLEFGPRDMPLAGDREWIRGAIAISLQEATDAALEVLASSVTRALERAPNGLLERYERSHHLADLGFE